MSSATVSVRVQARARRGQLLAVRDGKLIVRVAAPALDGRANRAVCRLLAKRLGVPTSSVAILRGLRSRDKVIVVEGVDQATADTVLQR